MARRRVLVVSYTFPPQYDISARRVAKLCKYLPAAGWDPVVLTKDWTRDVAPEDERAYAVVSYPQALAEIPDVPVIRAPYRTPDNRLRRLHARLGGAYAQRTTGSATSGAPERLTSQPPVASARRWSPRALTRRTLSLIAPAFGDFPDAFRGWVPGAVEKGVEIVETGAIDAIFSVCPPATAHVVASAIARRTAIPWVAQFDDLFSFHLEQQRAAWRPYADRRHRGWMRLATYAAAITPGMLEYVRRTYALDGDVVMVGFDPDDGPPAATPARRDRMRLVYTGSIYPGNQRPELLFDALERLHADDARPPIDMVFAGTGRDAELQAMLASYPNATRVCSFLGRVPPTEALRLQREADALVFLNYTNATPGEGTLSFPAKAFEYLNAGRPILALPCDPGAWGDHMLHTTHAGVTADSAARAAGVLGSWLATWRDRGTLPYEGRAHEIARYSQPRQAEVLARLLGRAVDARNGVLA